MASADVTRAATGDDLDGSNSQTFSFDPPAGAVFVQSHPITGPTIYAKIESDSAGTDDWDFVLQPGQANEIFKVQERGQGINKVTLYGDGAATYGTDFVVKGRG